jgi:putative transposase
VLLRLAYLGVTNAPAMLRPLPTGDRDKDVEILALHHQITVLQRQLHGEKIRAMAPRPGDSPPRGRFPSQACRAAAHGAVHSHVGATPGTKNQLLGYRRIHGELLVLGIKVAAFTVWGILREAGIDPAPQRTQTWATFLRAQAEAIRVADFCEVVRAHQGPHVRPRGDRARQPPRPHPGRHRTSHRHIGHPGRTQPRHGPSPTFLASMIV